MQQGRQADTKKARHPNVHFRPRPDQEPTIPSTHVEASGKIMQKKAQSNWTHFLSKGTVFSFFTWSVSDELP